MPEEISFDEAAARVERDFLRRLAETAPDDAIRELAGELLAGRIRWSEAARSHAYGEPLAQVMTPVVEDPRFLDPDAIAHWQAEAYASAEALGRVAGLPDPAVASRIGRPG
ncbi:hypothetical protein [Actinoplanes sp. NPDC051411]|uniref:hypothetical protein n=1 Tax=Actinoplanes sp. NPDC051411 TaxID=3155522 RepID=UPI00341A5D9B